MRIEILQIDEYLDEIRKWYETHFRIKFETPDVFPNG